MFNFLSQHIARDFEASQPLLDAPSQVCSIASCGLGYMLKLMLNLMYAKFYGEILTFSYWKLTLNFRGHPDSSADSYLTICLWHHRFDSYIQISKSYFLEKNIENIFRKAKENENHFHKFMSADWKVYYSEQTFSIIIILIFVSRELTW